MYWHIQKTEYFEILKKNTLNIWFFSQSFYNNILQFYYFLRTYDSRENKFQLEKKNRKNNYQTE